MQLTRSLLTASAALFLGLLPCKYADGHVSERVKQIVQGMTLKDKAGQMVRRPYLPTRCVALNLSVILSFHSAPFCGVDLMRASCMYVP